MNRLERRRQERLAKKSAARHPAEAIKLYDLAVALQNRGKAAEAEDHYRRALEIDPGLTDAHNNLGNLLRGRGRLDEAAACYRRCIELDADYVMGHYNLANTLQDQKKLDEAVASYKRALEIQPEDADTYNNLGNALRAQGKIDEAMGCYYHALSIVPDHPLVHYNLGNVFRDQKKYDGAIACYRKALRINPRYPMALVTLGDVLRKKKRTKYLEEAEDCYRRAIALVPGLAAAHINLGDLVKSRGRFEEAVQCFRRALEIEPNNANLHNNLGNTYKDLEQIDLAQACYRRALEIDPEHPEARLNFAKEHDFSPGDPEFDKLKALLDYEGLSSYKRTQLRFALGKAHDDLGLYDEAFAYFERGNREMAATTKFDAAEHRREIERIIEVFQDAPAPVPETDDRAECVPVFVLGMSRSGKSLTESLLARHPAVHGAGEKHMWFSALEDLRARYSIAESYPELATRLEAHQLRELGKTYVDRISRYAPTCRYLVNTLPGHYRYVGLILRALPNAKLVYCERDALDHCLQIYFKMYGTGHEYAYTFENLASYMADYRTMMDFWQGLFPDRIVRIRYEDLVTETAETGARLYRHCGLDFDPALAEPEFSARQIGHWKNYEAHLEPLRAALEERRGNPEIGGPASRRAASEPEHRDCRESAS